MMYSMIPFGRYHGGLDTIFDDLERSFFPPANRQPTAFRTDIRDEGDHFLLEAELPGFQKEDIHLELKEGVLTISAQHEEKQEKQGRPGPIPVPGAPGSALLSAPLMPLAFRRTLSEPPMRTEC